MITFLLQVCGLSKLKNFLVKKKINNEKIVVFQSQKYKKIKRKKVGKKS